MVGDEIIEVIWDNDHSHEYENDDVDGGDSDMSSKKPEYVCKIL